MMIRKKVMTDEIPIAIGEVLKAIPKREGRILRLTLTALLKNFRSLDCISDANYLIHKLAIVGAKLAAEIKLNREGTTGLTATSGLDHFSLKRDDRVENLLGVERAGLEFKLYIEVGKWSLRGLPKSGWTSDEQRRGFPLTRSEW